MPVDIVQVDNMLIQSAEHDCLTEMAIYSVHHQTTMMHFPGSLRVISRRISPQTHLTLPSLLDPFSTALQPILHPFSMALQPILLRPKGCFSSLAWPNHLLQ